MTPHYRPHQIRWTPEKVGSLWSYYSSNPAYDETYFSKHTGRSILRYIQSHIPLGDGRILDFGCGKGHMLRLLLDSGYVCQGLEFSPQSAELAEETIGEHPLFEGVIRGQSYPTPVPDSSFNTVLLIEVLEHLFDEQLLPTLEEIRRVL
ncbi:MAG: class I SAM-dependent methyltransferase, partial [Anaerolineales bacterium]